MSSPDYKFTTRH